MDRKYKGYWISQDWKTKQFHIKKDGQYIACANSIKEAKTIIDGKI